MKTLLIPLVICFPLILNAQNWMPVGSGLRSPGNNKEVNVLCEFNGDLYTGSLSAGIYFIREEASGAVMKLVKH